MMTADYNWDGKETPSWAPTKIAGPREAEVKPPPVVGSQFSLDLYTPSLELW